MATMATAAPVHAPPAQQRGHPHQAPMLPLFDLFLDLPHPAGSTSCPPPIILPAPGTTAETEKELSANLSRIARFAFPEYDDATAQQIPRDAPLNRFSQYAMQPKTFQRYTFSLQLQSGVRLHGHVRRYLPIHAEAKYRYDIGRRGERALVLLTRANGGDLVYSAILKTVDALSFQNLVMADKLHAHKEPQKWFLTNLFEQHKHLSSRFNSLPFQERKPMILSVNRLEAGEKRIAGLEQVDSARFLIPTELLNSTSSAIESGTSSSILPVLRTLGVENTLRLVSALLSESRILLISNSPTRLAQCARSALSILAQGLLNWQHLYIPVLPPHLFQYIAAPVPYLIGILTSLAPRLDQPPAAETLGELVIINLDQCRMETRGMNPDEVDKRIPDLLGRGAASGSAPQGYMAATDMLAQDLLDLLKVDKRALHGESGLTNVAETAVKASKAVKSGFMKLRNKGKKFLQTRSGSMENGVSADESEPSTDETEDEDAAQKMLPDYIYTQGAQNEQAEDEARIAFASFFLSMFGNMRWYLSANPGKLPELDKQRFLQQKRALGDGESSAMWPLLQNFCQTQMLEQFAKERVEEVKTQIPVTAASPLFSKCTNYHRQHSIDFNVINVRRVARQMAQNNPARTILQTSARRMAMTMTSNRTFEGDYNKAVSQLVEQCRECSSVLYDVMSVIWVRLRDSKGLHWKHGFQGLQIMRNLLYHGPVAVIAEATDGLEKIRSMKFYNDNMRSQICTQIRQAANEVYNLLVDRAKLFNIRRVCINKRRVMQKSDQGRYNKETRVKVHMPFGKIHAAFNPKVRSQIAPAPHFGGEQDLIGMSAPAATVVPPTTAARSQEAPSAAGATQDIMDLFQNASVSQDQPSATSGHDPFAAPPVQTSPTQAQPRSPQQALDPQAQAHAYWAQPATGHVGAAAQPVQTAYAPNQSRMPPQAPNAQQPPQAYAGQQMAPPQHQHRAYAAPAPAQTPAHAYPQGYAQGQPQGQGYPPPQQGYPPPQQGYPPPQQGYPHAPVPQPTAHAHAQHPGGYGAAAQQQQAYQQYQNTQQQTAPRPPPSQFDPFG